MVQFNNRGKSMAITEHFEPTIADRKIEAVGNRVNEIEWHLDNHNERLANVEALRAYAESLEEMVFDLSNRLYTLESHSRSSEPIIVGRIKKLEARSPVSRRTYVASVAAFGMGLLMAGLSVVAWAS